VIDIHVLGDGEQKVEDVRRRHSGQEDAESVLEIDSPRLASESATYIDSVRDRHPPLVLEP
jgi:hypothetical protein